MPGPEKSLALDLHRQPGGAGDHPGDVRRARFNRLFQDRVHGVKAVP